MSGQQAPTTNLPAVIIKRIIPLIKSLNDPNLRWFIDGVAISTPYILMNSLGVSKLESTAEVISYFGIIFKVEKIGMQASQKS